MAKASSDTIPQPVELAETVFAGDRRALEKLIVGMDDSTISLANGCVCCEIDDDLIGVIESLIGRDESPDYILLEASGIADPFGIAMTVGNRRFEDTIRLDGIISVVDLAQIFADWAWAGRLVY